jgi:hypothetical protein
MGNLILVAYFCKFSNEPKDTNNLDDYGFNPLPLKFLIDLEMNPFFILPL